MGQVVMGSEWLTSVGQHYTGRWDMSQFRKGEVAIFIDAGSINADQHPFKDGDELLITDVLPINSHRHMIADCQYYCVGVFVLEERHLRKRPDPGRERHLSGCKPYDKSYEDTIKELGHVTEEAIRKTLANLGFFYGTYIVNSTKAMK